SWDFPNRGEPLEIIEDNASLEKRGGAPDSLRSLREKALEARDTALPDPDHHDQIREQPGAEVISRRDGESKRRQMLDDHGQRGEAYPRMVVAAHHHSDHDDERGDV